MTFDFNAQQEQILARLADAATAAGLAVHPDEDVIDLTDIAEPVGVQIVFLDIVPVDQAGGSSLHHAQWAFDAYIDTTRATTAQKTALASLFSAAMTRLIGWEISAGRFVRAEKVQRSGSEGRVRRRSFGFTIPVYLAA